MAAGSRARNGNGWCCGGKADEIVAQFVMTEEQVCGTTFNEGVHGGAADNEATGGVYDEGVGVEVPTIAIAAS
jgi:hypothetical protein